MVVEKSAHLLTRRFGGGAKPIIAEAPGRINLIGEHTDYNAGYVLPFAIEKTVQVAIRPREDRRVLACTEAFPDVKEIQLPPSHAEPTGKWSDYLIGVLIEFAGIVSLSHGFDVAIASDVPFGAGLSSSAALEIALALGIVRLYNLEVSDLQLLELCQRSEVSFVGANCGIMDQYASLLAKDGSALLLNVATMKHRHIPVRLDDASFLVVDTLSRRSLAGSGYNERRRECSEALATLRSELPGDPPSSLSTLTVEGLAAAAASLDRVQRDRVTHVVLENQRVKRTARALARGDAVEVGRMLYESHESLRDLFQVSTDKLDLLVDWAGEHGAHGARLVGGGFGGATLHLVPSSSLFEYKEGILSAYRRETGQDGDAWEVSPGPGAKELCERSSR